jgi:2Fe-2S ferredoxin
MVQDASRFLECACGGICACSTCHVYVDDKFYDKLKVPEEEEQDMLDLAWECGPTSRLACRISLDQSIDGMVITVPEQANNMRG